MHPCPSGSGTPGCCSASCLALMSVQCVPLCTTCYVRLLGYFTQHFCSQLSCMLEA